MKKILFVEDDKVVSHIYSRKLADSGFKVMVVEDGLTAMKELMAFRPDLVVLDVLIPKMNGIDVLKFIRQQPEIKSVPVVVFSNVLLTDLGDVISGLGVQEALVKASVTPSLLIKTITNIFSRQESSAAKAAGKPTAPAVPAAAEPRSAIVVNSQIQKHFFGQIPMISESLRKLCAEFVQPAEHAVQFRRIEVLRQKVGFVTHMAGMAECHRIAHLSGSLEALLFKLQEDVAFVNDSTRNTVSATIAFLGECLGRAEQLDELCSSPTNVFIVDDDAVSNLALTYALDRIAAGVTTALDPFTALQKLRDNPYDVVILDINLPGMNGIAVCEQMREIPFHRQTPVIFITGHPEFKESVEPMMRPGDDWILKPVLPVELAVKIMTLTMKRRITGQPAVG